MPQQRIWWAVEAVGFAQLGSQTYTAAHGVQNVGVTTAFNLDPVFELGQSRIYENLENIPNIEVQMEKLLDGYPLLYHLATNGAPSATLFGRSNQRTNVALSLFPDTNDSASGAVTAQVDFSGMYVSSVGYQFPADGKFSENVGLVGNYKLWKTTNLATFSGGFDNTDRPLALTYDSGGIQRRQNMLFEPITGVTMPTTRDENGQVNATTSNKLTILPPDVAGISASGLNELIPGGSNRVCSIQNISTSVDLGREAIFELGHYAPYYRYMTVPVQVSTDIEIIAKSGDYVSATEAGVYSNFHNTRQATIKIATQDGMFIDLGTKNRLSNISIGGGDTGGGNMTVTYTFVTNNDFSVTHPQDPTAGIRI